MMVAMADANGAATLGENTSEMAELTGSAVLVVIGEPFTADHKELILERITKGFRIWDVEATGCDINQELSALASSAPTGEDGPNGEVIIQYTSSAINVTALINPQCATVSTHVRQLLISGGKHRHLMYTGHTIQGSGDWLLQDDTFTYEKFAEIAKSTDVENALKQQDGGSLDVSVFDEGNWKEAHMAKQSFAKLLKVQVNPEEKLTDINGILQFSAYLTFFVKVRTIKELLKASDVVGNIRFSRPTLYIFPGSQGDSALFGISGFNLLVNGGYSRKSCFWDFTRHLDRIDAVVNTHLGANNFMGVSAVLERKATENVHPEIGFMYMNAVEKSKHSPNGDAQPENGGSHKPASLLVSLVDEGNKIVQNLKALGQNPSPCIGRISGSQLDPITLYHKVGHGTLDMFVLNPLQDNKDVKEFLSQWNKDVNNFSMVKGGNRGGNIPLPSMCSICALLVWRPSVPTEKITRILFPGSAPQSRIFEGLDKLKNMDIFQHETCSDKTLHAPKGCNKKAPAASKPAARAPTPRATPVPKAEPKKAAEKKPTKVEKGAKEETNKKALEKKGKKSPTSSKSTTPASMTPSQSASEVSSPQHEKVPSPLESHKEPCVEEKQVKVETPEADVKVEESSKPEADQIPSPVPEPEPAPVVAEPAHSPEPLPDPERIDGTAFEPSAPAPVEEVVAEPEKVVPVEAAPEPVEAAPEPVEAAPEPVAAAPEPVEVAPAPVETAPAPVEAEPEAVPEPAQVKQEEQVREEEVIKPVEVETVEAVQPAQLEPTPYAAEDDKKSLEDLGIYDDEKDVDTAETTHSAASQASSQAVDDQGLVDDEPESLKSPPTEPLVDMGFSDKVEAEQVEAIAAATEAAPAEVAQAPVVEHDGAASQQPEVDQMVFGGAAPEGLPEPAEPVLEPEMCMEQDFLDQIQQGVVGLKETDMPPVPEPELVAAIAEQHLQKTPEAELDAPQEPTPEAAQEPTRVQSPEIEIAEEPQPEDDQALSSLEKPADLPASPEPTEQEPTPVIPEPEVELATEPQVESAREAELEVAQEPEMELPEVDRLQEAIPEPEPEVEVELAEKAELMPEDSTPHQVSSGAHEEALSDNEPLEIAAKADEEVAQTSLPEPAIEAAEAPQPEECSACDDRKMFAEEPSPKSEEPSQIEEPVALPVEEAEEAAESAQTEECAACDDRKLFPDEPESTAEIVSSPETQSLVEEALEAAETAEDLECKACDDRKLFPEEPLPQTPSPLPMEVEEPEKDDHTQHSQKSGLSSEDEHDLPPAVKEEEKDIPAFEEHVQDTHKHEEMPSPVDDMIVSHTTDQLESAPEETEAKSPETVPVESQSTVEESLVEQGTTEKYVQDTHKYEEMPSPVDDLMVSQTTDQLESEPEEREAKSPEIMPVESQSTVEESLVEQGTTEKLQVAELEDLPTPSEPSLSEQFPVTDEDSSAYDKEHDGDDDSLQHQQSAMDTSIEGTLPPTNNPFDIIDGPTRPVDPMSMSFFDDGSQSTNPFLGMDGGSFTGLQPDVMQTIPQTTNGLPQDQNQNPFDVAPGVTPSVQALQHEGVERDSLEREENTFDPLKEWGQPMGLPAPAPPAEKAAEKKEADAKKPGAAATARKVDPKKPASAPKTGARKPADPKAATAKKDPVKKEPSTPRKEAVKKEPVKKDSPKREPPKPKNGPTSTLKNGTSKDTKNTTAPKAPSAAPKKEPPKRDIKKTSSRPSTAPAKTESAKSEAAKRESPRPSVTKRPATASKAPTAKAPTPTPVVPFYVDLTYVPNHGDMHYVDLDFFRRVRARYYVISALNPSPGVLNALLEAKQMWENPDAEVTLIPTYDTETLRHWMGLHRDQLAQLKIDVAPSASRCTIQLQDHETSCAAYRLEF